MTRSILTLLVFLVCGYTAAAASFSTCNTGISTLNMTSMERALPQSCQPQDDAFQEGLFMCLESLSVNVTDCNVTIKPTLPVVVAYNSTGSNATVPCSSVLKITGPLTGESIAYGFTFSLFGAATNVQYPNEGDLEPSPSFYRFGNSMVIDWNGYCKYEYKILSGNSIMKPNWGTCDLPVASYKLQNAGSLSGICTGATPLAGSSTSNPVHRAIFECLKNVQISSSICVANVSAPGYVTIDGTKFNCAAIGALGTLTGNRTAEWMKWSFDQSMYSVSGGGIFPANSLTQPWLGINRLYPNLTFVGDNMATISFSPDCVFQYTEATSAAVAPAVARNWLLAMLVAASMLLFVL